MKQLKSILLQKTYRVIPAIQRRRRTTWGRRWRRITRGSRGGSWRCCLRLCRLLLVVVLLIHGNVILISTICSIRVSPTGSIVCSILGRVVCWACSSWRTRGCLRCTWALCRGSTITTTVAVVPLTVSLTVSTGAIVSLLWWVFLEPFILFLDVAKQIFA